MKTFQQGIQALNQDLFHIATPIFQSNIDANIQWTQSMLAMATINFRSYHRQTAIDIYNQILKAHKNNGEAFTGKGRVLASMAKYEEALQCLNMGIKIDDGSWKAHEAKGYVLNRMHKYPQSLFCFENAITKNSKNDPISYLGRAEAFFSTKNIELAYKDIQYAHLATKQQSNLIGLSKTQTQILNQGLAKYDKLKIYVAELEKNKKMTTFQNICYELQAIKMINKAYHLHNLNLLRNGMINIRQAVEKNEILQSDTVVVEGQQPIVTCRPAKNICRTH